MPRRRRVDDEMRIEFHKGPSTRYRIADATLADGHTGVDELRRAVGARWWHDALTPGRLERTDAELRATALAWDRLAPEGSLARTWRPPAPKAREG